MPDRTTAEITPREVASWPLEDVLWLRQELPHEWERILNQAREEGERMDDRARRFVELLSYG